MNLIIAYNFQKMVIIKEMALNKFILSKATLKVSKTWNVLGIENILLSVKNNSKQYRVD